MLHMIVNDEKWNSLPKQYQAIVNQAGAAAGAWMIEKYDSVNPAALKRLVAGGAELRAFPQPVMEASTRPRKTISTRSPRRARCSRRPRKATTRI